MSDENRFRQLPAGFDKVGGPIDQNPFPPEDPRHRAWEDATRKAEECLCRFNAKYLAAVQAHPDIWLLPDLVAGTFDIWAERGLAVLYWDSELAPFDQWLATYANAWLRDLPGDLPSSLMEPVRVRLMERIRHWQAEARAWVASDEVRRYVAGIRAAPGDALVRSVPLAEASAQQDAPTVQVPIEARPPQEPAAAPAETQPEGQTSPSAATHEPAPAGGATKPPTDGELRQYVSGLKSLRVSTAHDREQAVDAVVELYRRANRGLCRADIWRKAGYPTKPSNAKRPSFRECERWLHDNPKGPGGQHYTNATLDGKVRDALKALLLEL